MLIDFDKHLDNAWNAKEKAKIISEKCKEIEVLATQIMAMCKRTNVPTKRLQLQEEKLDNLEHEIYRIISGYTSIE